MSVIVNYKCIPEELRKRNQWVVHINKIPYDPKNGKSAKVSDPNTWSSFDTALKAVSTGSYSGLGFVFSKDDPYVGVDFDHCFIDGKLDSWVREQIKAIGSYTEISPSGSGIHIICRGKLPSGSIKTKKVELYDTGRYFTVTGNFFSTVIDVKDASKYICELSNSIRPHEKASAEPQKQSVTRLTLSDAELIEKAENAANGEVFRALMAGDLSRYENDHSRADMALCSLLAYWTAKDIEQMDRIFRSSGLMREKWDRPQTGSTYGRLQLEKAAREARNVYDPEEYQRQQTLNAFKVPETHEKKPSAGLNFFTASDLAEKNLTPVRYFVDDILPQGLALLCAPPKYGKSWFVLDLCLAITQGKDFIGRKTHRAACLYLALEDSENRLQGRMNKLLDGSKAPDNFAMSINAENLDSGLMDQLETVLQVIPNLGVIVIDTLQKVRGSVGKNEGAYKYDYREMSVFKQFADKHGICILLVHHLRKMVDDSDPHNRISGTNGIMGAADTSMVITKDKRSNEAAMLSITGRDVDMNDIELRFDKESCHWQPVAQKDVAIELRTKYENSKLVKLVKAILHQNNGTWQGTMTDLVNLSRMYRGCEIYEHPRKVTSMVQGIEADLNYYDDITIERIAKNGKSGGAEYLFRDSWMLEQGIG